MVRKKRVYAPTQKNDSPASTTSVVAQFDDIMEGASYLKVDVHSCVPMTRVRKKSTSGVARLMQIFDSDYQKGPSTGSNLEADTAGCGISLGSGTPIVVELRGTMMRFVYEFFQIQGFPEQEVKIKVESKEVWYGIVDGEHSHDALVKLMALYERWRGFQWFVTVLKGGHSLSRYKQLAITNNAKHDCKYYIEMTFYDRIYNMKEEHIRLRAEGRPANGTEVAKVYSGLPPKKIRSIIQVANTVVRLDAKVVDTIGEIMNGEFPEVCVTSKVLGTTFARTIEEAMRTVDCRIYRNFLNINSIKSATSFMNASGEKGVEAQIHAIHRSRFICHESNFRSVTHKIVNAQFKLAKSAMAEEQRFLSFISPDSWPTEMKEIRTKLLRTTVFDKELTSKQDDDSDSILPSLLEFYKMKYPSVASQKESKFKRFLQLNSNNSNQNDQADGGDRNASTSSNPEPSPDVEASNSDFHPSTQSKNASTTAGSNKDNSLNESNKDSEESTLKQLDNVENDKSEPDTNGNGEDDDDANERLDDDACDDAACDDAPCDDADGDESSVASKHAEVQPSNDYMNSEKDNCTEQGNSDSKGTTKPSRSKSEIVEELEIREREDALRYYKISSFNMTWQFYEKVIMNDTSDRADLVITDPPTAPSRGFIRKKREKGNLEEIESAEVREFTNFTKRILKPGGYCLIFLPIYMFQEWYECFSDTAFTVMSSLYTINYDEKTVPKRNVSDFPQQMTDFIMIAKAPGEHPDGFQPTFDTKFNLINCSSTRRRSAVENVPFVKHKLRKKKSRSPFRTSEKPIGLLSELIDLFSPVGGLVLDPYAGTLTAGIAAIRTRRQSILVEKEKECYQYALLRLGVMASLLRDRSIKSAKDSQQEDDIILVAMSKGQPDLQLNIETTDCSNDEDDQSESGYLEDKDDSKEGAFAPASDLSLETQTSGDTTTEFTRAEISDQNENRSMNKGFNSSRLDSQSAMTDDNPPVVPSLKNSPNFKEGYQAKGNTSENANLLLLVDACDTESNKVVHCSGGSTNTKPRKRVRFNSSEYTKSSYLNERTELVQSIRPQRKKAKQTNGDVLRTMLAQRKSRRS